MADAHIEVVISDPIGMIAPEIYSHFLEHLGGVIEDGVWVGENSKIPNIRGVRKEFIDRMREVQAPAIRWPGGCFADIYDWHDGIGPRANRPQRRTGTNHEDTNQYGTHEFMATCRAIGAEPYFGVNMMGMTPLDFYHWMEYCNAPKSANGLATQRAANGSPEPFNMRYWGVGNEAWGCGGNMTPSEYGEAWNRYTSRMPNFGDAASRRLVACGPGGHDLTWTAGVMHAIKPKLLPWGLSLHFYTSAGKNNDALTYRADDYYRTLIRASYIDTIISDHWGVMAESDPTHQVKLIVDEWGAWYADTTRVQPTFNLSQQLTMRDALLSAITLDTFNKHADKVAMSTVAQTINCLNSLMLAYEDHFIVTPVFYVFKMYLPHRGAQSVRTEFSAAPITDTSAPTGPMKGDGNAEAGTIARQQSLAGLSGSASIKGKSLTLTVVNPHLDRPMTTEIVARGASIASGRGTVLHNDDIHAHNTFEMPNTVMTSAVEVRPQGGTLLHTFPPGSVTTLQLVLGI
jgi:alpha-L-arabinofuranosidase